LDTFRGKTFHSANWDHDYDLTASMSPSSAPARRRFSSFRRSNRSSVIFIFSSAPRRGYCRNPITTFRDRTLALSQFSVAQRALRAAEFEALEMFSYGFRHPRAMRHVERIGRWHLRRSVKKSGAPRKAHAAFTLGCKRILLSNTYYRALAEPNAEVHHTEVTRIEENAVIGADGLARNVDTIIFGTGFKRDRSADRQSASS